MERQHLWLLGKRVLIVAGKMQEHKTHRSADEVVWWLVGILDAAFLLLVDGILHSPNQGLSYGRLHEGWDWGHWTAFIVALWLSGLQGAAFNFDADDAER